MCDNQSVGTIMVEVAKVCKWNISFQSFQPILRSSSVLVVVTFVQHCTTWCAHNSHVCTLDIKITCVCQ